MYVLLVHCHSILITDIQFFENLALLFMSDNLFTENGLMNSFGPGFKVKYFF